MLIITSLPILALLNNRKIQIYIDYLFYRSFLISLFRFRLIITIDNSGPLIALDTRSVTSRAAWAEIHAKKLTLVLRSYTLEEMLRNGLFYGKFYYLQIITIIIVKKGIKIIRVIFCLFQVLVVYRSVLIILVLVL